MPWPSRSDYAGAVGGYPHISMQDTKLKGGIPRRRSDNVLISYSGGFSIVFPIEMSSSTYAMRCWIADIDNAETRYREISSYLKHCGLPYFVDCEYVSEGILVNGKKYPITRMEWAEGDTLCDFIKLNLQDARCLETVAAEFQKMVQILHTNKISHGDLQDGNVLLKRIGSKVQIKLIDYDSIIVPTLLRHPNTVLGIAEYQHPQRMAGTVVANEKVDYFSELVIYLTLLSLAEQPGLWSNFKVGTERAFLFRAEDFKNPDQSLVFRELESLSSDVKHLASKLKEFCKLSVDQLEPLEAVLPKPSPAQNAFNQGHSLRRSNRYNEAIVEFENAIALDQNFKEAHHGLSLVYLKMNDLGAAEKCSQAALGIDPNYQPALQLLSVIRQKLATYQPPPTPPTPTPTLQLSSHWKYICAGLASVLVIFIIAFRMQMNSKNKVIRQNQALQAQLDLQGTELTSLESKNQTMHTENQKLERVNKKLQKQLDDAKQADSNRDALETEKAKLMRENQKLRNEKTALQNQLDKFTTQPDVPQVEDVPSISGKLLHRLSGHSAMVLCVVFSPDGQMLASASSDKTIRLWDAATGKHRQTLNGHTAGVYSIAFSPDGRTLATGSADRTVRLWDAATGKHRQTLNGHTNWVYSVVFSSDGQMLASGSSDKTIRLWEIGTRNHPRILIGHSGDVRSIAFSSDGETLASGSFDKTIRVWNAVTGKHRRTLTGHKDWVYSVAFSQDGQTLVSGSIDKTVRLWDSVTGEHLQTIFVHTGAVYSVAFSPDGRTLASGSFDKTVCLWDSVTGMYQQTLTGHTDAVYTIAFSPDSHRIASGSWDHTIRVID